MTVLTLNKVVDKILEEGLLVWFSVVHVVVPA